MLKRFFNRLFSAKKPVKHRQVSQCLLLDHFKPFSDLPKNSQILMAGFAEVVTYRCGDKLFKAGMNDDVDYFLLEGRVVLTTDEGDADDIESGSDKSRMALGLLRPRQLSGVVQSIEATFYTVPHHIVQMAYQQTRQAASVAPQLEVVIGDIPQETLLERVEKEVVQGHLSLVSLPEVAIKVKNACEDSESSLDTIADIISRDASIAIKLLQSANSPIYRGAVEIKTVKEAVARLGKKITQHLVFYFATKELFQSPIKSLDKAFRSSWDHSFKRAIMAKTVARLYGKHFDAEVAFLCGLLFRIGDLVLLQYVAGHVEQAEELKKIQHITEKEAAANSRLVVAQWNLPDVVNSVLTNGGDWQYAATAKKADYNELIIAANVLLRVMNKNVNGLPSLDKIPALKKILNKGFAPHTSIILEYRKALADFSDIG